ncbi:MAG: UDP-4-amino-4,6-dideoxy-N-acetyl-beta-L-altrosamine transaminase [Myxococcales bacterium]|nr:UDP-4-amino-4,6-dideoxy-N-acetyl-beta-L-altrosamine transaminase [Myxococcales bacterium]
MSDLPRLPYGRQSIDERDIEAVTEVLRGDWLTTGPKVQEFENALAELTGVPRAVVVNSGSAALHVAYFAAGLGPGDEIVTSPLTFVSTASCALHLGAKVRFADVDPSTGNLDPAAVDAVMGPDCKLIVPVDYAGHPADYAAMRAISERRGVAIVSDGAHSLGARREGRSVAQLADATATSFHPVKGVTTAEGGAVFTAREDWAERAERFRNHGIERVPVRHRKTGGSGYYEVQDLGLNYRLPDVLCALGLSQLRRLDEFLARRREIAAQYSSAFAGIDGLELPTTEVGVEPSWHLYVIRVREAKRRDPLFDRLRAEGLGVQVHYRPVHLHPLFEDLGFIPGSCPVAEDYAARAISLPIFPAMGDDDLERVIDILDRSVRDLLV